MANERDPFAERFIDWINRFSGCRFVQRFAKQPGTSAVNKRPARIVCASSANDIGATALNRFFEGCAAQEAAGVAIFPALTTEAELARLLRRIGEMGRWRLSSREDTVRDALLVSLEWRTSEDKWSRTMGFAPLLTMPPTRRAPYAAIAMWPGASQRAEREDVGFIDMPSRIKDHRKLIKESMTRVRELLGEDPDGAPWRNTAFSLARGMRKRVGG
jgi:hypothetical protein